MQVFGKFSSVCALALLSVSAWAVETTLEVGYKLSHSDNSNRSSVDPILVQRFLRCRLHDAERHVIVVFVRPDDDGQSARPFQHPQECL